MYYDEIDMLEGLPKFEDIKSIDRDEDWFYLTMKNGDRKNLFMCLESLTRREFEQICFYLIKKIKR